MKNIFLYIFSFLFFVSCTKDKNLEPLGNSWCSTSPTATDTLPHKYIIKLQVDGGSVPDSIDFVSNNGYSMFGNLYFKRFRNPTLSLSDSGLVFAKTGNSISIIIYNSDTTKLFTSKIFVNNTLKIEEIGNINSITKKHTVKYYF